jgi:hypothetical protein
VIDLVGVRAGVGDAERHLWDCGVCVMYATPDVVVMKMHDCVIEPRTGLRMVMFGAGVLAVLVLACAGTAAGAAAGEEGAA